MFSHFLSIHELRAGDSFYLGAAKMRGILPASRTGTVGWDTRRQFGEGAICKPGVPDIYRKAAAIVEIEPYHGWYIAVANLVHNLDTASSVIHQDLLSAL
jgi:hypothetical protein